METKIKLTPDQQAVLDGKSGEIQAKVMKTLVMLGNAFGATEMVPVSSKKGHLVISFAPVVMKPVLQLMQKLIDDGALSKQELTADPYPIDKNIPLNPLQNLVHKIIYSKQKKYDEQLKKLGVCGKDKYSCACYMDEVGNTPQKGEILSWAESSAVVYANSVLGARCNRNSGIIELFGSIAGCVPKFDLLTDEGRKAKWLVELQTTEKPEAQILGSAIGARVMEDVPYIKGLSKYLGASLDDETKAYLKDMGGAAAASGAVGLYHVENLTPEAVGQSEMLLSENAKTYVIDDTELERVKSNFACQWKNPDARPKLAFVGCPHLSLAQLKDWTQKLRAGLRTSEENRLQLTTVFMAAPDIIREFNKSEYARDLEAMGGILSHTCPLMYMSNPLVSKMPVVTNSIKLRTYTTARYVTDAVLEELLLKGGQIV